MFPSHPPTIPSHVPVTSSLEDGISNSNVLLARDSFSLILQGLPQCPMPTQDDDMLGPQVNCEDIIIFLPPAVGAGSTPHSPTQEKCLQAHTCTTLPV